MSRFHIIRLSALCALALMLAAVPALAGDARGLAWRVADDAGNAAWLVGTVHAAGPAFYPLPQAIEDALDGSEVLVVEVDTGRLEPAEIGRITARHGLYQPPDSLKRMLPEEAWRLATRWAKRFRIPPSELEQMRPWLAAVTFVALEMRRIGLDPQLGMEQHFVRRAAQAGIEVGELESFEEQIGMLAGLSPDVQLRFLEESLRNAGDIGETVARVKAAWRAGDFDGMATFMDETYGNEEELYGVMLRDRNRRWMPRIEQMIASGRTHFFAVGALHLTGPDGLVALLEARGYRLDQL